MCFAHLSLVGQAALWRYFGALWRFVGTVLWRTAATFPCVGASWARSAHQVTAHSARRNTAEIAVLLPVEERFDGTGGAIATWVRNAYAHLDDDVFYRIYCPAVSSAFAGSLPVAHLRSYAVLDRMLRRMSRLLGALFRRNPHGVLRVLTVQGIVWVRSVLPALTAARVVHVHNRPGYAVQLRRSGYSGRVVLHMHNDAVESVQSWIKRGYGRSRSAMEVLSAVDHWVFCSEFLRRRVCDSFALSQAVTSVLYNGVTVEKKAVIAPVPQARGAQRGLISAVFAGRLIKEKGVVEAVRACGIANRYFPTSLDIYGGKATGFSSGGSSYISAVRREAERVNAECGAKRVRLHGYVPPAVLLTELERADVMLYPCRWDEPFGMVLVDALSVGTPVIAPARGGIPEIVRDRENGRLLLAEAGEDDFADALLELARSSQYSEIARAAMLTARTAFSWEKIAEQLLFVLEERRVE